MLAAVPDSEVCEPPNQIILKKLLIGAITQNEKKYMVLEVSTLGKKSAGNGCNNVALNPRTFLVKKKKT